MSLIASCTTRLGAALLGAVLFMSTPAIAGDCCGDKEKEVVKSSTPEECFASLACAMECGDKAVMFSLLTTASQEAVSKKGEELKAVAEKCEDTQKALGMTVDQVKAASGKDIMLGMMLAHVKAMSAKEAGCCDDKGADDKKVADAKKPEMKDLKIDGDKATATCPYGMPLAFEKTKDGWRMDIRAMLEKDSCDKEEGGCCPEEGKAKE